jgi:hypothetical protein
VVCWTPFRSKQKLCPRLLPHDWLHPFRLPFALEGGTEEYQACSREDAEMPLIGKRVHLGYAETGKDLRKSSDKQREALTERSSERVPFGGGK